MLDSQQNTLNFPTGSAGQQQCELIASQACYRVFGPQAAPEGIGEMQQCSVASRVAVVVVDPLEVIQIEQGAGKYHRRLIRMRVACPPKSTPVEQRRQVVLVKCVFGLTERKLQLGDSAGQLGATTAAKEGGQHSLALSTDKALP